MCSKRVISIALVLLFFVAMVLSPCINVHADSFPSEFYVNSDVYYSAEELGIAYMDLNSDQEEIANYLLGMYNLFYLGARGFQFQPGTYSNTSTFIAKVKSFGYKLFHGAAEISLYSRFNSDFCKYASAVILYASQCNNVDFETWFQNLDEDFVIPVDNGLINSFTLMYNDNSNTGIATFGDVITPWDSGLNLNFAFSDFPWGGGHSNIYNDFLNFYGPVMYSNIVSYYGKQAQFIFGNDQNNSFPDTLFLLRGETFSNYAYGYATNVNEFRRVQSTDHFKYQGYYLSNGDLYFFGSNSPLTGDYKMTISSVTNPTSDLSDTIDWIFANNNPLETYSLDNTYYNLNGYYPYIGHVVLVDNLNTLSNAEEVFNLDSWDIFGNDNILMTPIDYVNLKPKYIATINLPDNSTAVDIQEIIDDQGDVVDDNGDPVNPWEITVVVQPNDTNPLSVDVNMFNGGTSYIDYLWGHTMKMAQYSKDLLDCLDFTVADGSNYGPKYAIYGVLVLGIAGGLVAKFLL